MDQPFHARAREPGHPIARVENPAVDSSWRNPFVFVDGKRLGDENARRAVGRANGTNMICIIIPCHRVIRADGTPCG